VPLHDLVQHLVGLDRRLYISLQHLPSHEQNILSSTKIKDN
jgi:hypothetical protein